MESLVMKESILEIYLDTQAMEGYLILMLIKQNLMLIKQKMIKKL
jgi:hypothetical protein